MRNLIHTHWEGHIDAAYQSGIFDGGGNEQNASCYLFRRGTHYFY